MSLPKCTAFFTYPLNVHQGGQQKNQTLLLIVPISVHPPLHPVVYTMTGATVRI